MKHITLIALAAIAAIAFACTKEPAPEQTAPEPQEATNDADIVCIDGALHFPTSELCFATMDALNSDEELSAFEKAHNFTSIRSFTNVMLDELIECETPEEYQTILETCTDYLVEDCDRLMPKITSVGYASIANTDGIFYVNGIKHTVSGDKVIIDTPDPVTRAITPLEFDCVVPCEGVSETRAETKKYTDERYETKKYKVFARTNLIRNVVAVEIRGKIEYDTHFTYQLHVSGQKKKALIGWNSYKDRFTVEAIHLDITLDGKRCTYGDIQDLQKISFTSGSTKDFYKTLPVEHVVHTRIEALPMPAKFNCVVFRARSGALKNCGAVTDYNICRPAIMLAMQNCI